MTTYLTVDDIERASEIIKAGGNREFYETDQYIEASYMKELILRKSKFLVHSPTGSGKTRATREAFQELVSESSLKREAYILAAPTRALTSQISNDLECFDFIGSKPKARELLKKHFEDGDRIFATTFDKLPQLYEFLKAQVDEIILVVDEFHKVVQDADFRRETMIKLEEVTKQPKVTSLIALSGTCLEIPLILFTGIIEVRQRFAPPLTQTDVMDVFLYEKRDELKKSLVSLIEHKVSKGSRLLIFLNSRKQIESVKRVLERSPSVRGIYTLQAQQEAKQTERGEPRRSVLYNAILAGRVPDKANVILTTEVISDGVSIHTGSNLESFETIVVTENFSNPSKIKQSSHRIRTMYKSFSLLMLKPKNDDTRPFDYEKDIETQLYRSVETSDRTTPATAESMFEKRHTHNGGRSEILAAHEASKNGNYYYQGRRLALAWHVAQMNGMIPRFVEIDELDKLDAELEQALVLDEERSKASKELKSTENHIKSALSLERFQILKDESNLSDKLLLTDILKEELLEHHRVSALVMAKYTDDYETFLKQVMKVKRMADSRRLETSCQLLVEIERYKLGIKQSVLRKGPVSSVLFQRYQSMVGEERTKKEWEDQAEKIARETSSKKIKYSVRDVKLIERCMQFTQRRTKSERFYVLEGFKTVESIAKEEGVSVDMILSIVTQISRQ